MTQDSKRMYEGMFLADSAIATSNWDEVEAELQRIFERADAEVLTLQKWDDRRLCFDVAGHKRGTYILTYFNAVPGSIGGMERDVQLSEKLLRVMILRADRIPESIREAPTPYMASLKSAPEHAEHKAPDDNQVDLEYPTTPQEEELPVPEKVDILHSTESSAPADPEDASSEDLSQAEASDETTRSQANATGSENS